jgi:phage/plasmid-associated DNA primase
MNEGKANEYLKYTFSPDKAADTIIQRWDLVSTKDETIWVYENGYYRSDAWTLIDATVDRVAGDYYNIKMSKETWRKVYLRTMSDEDPFNKNPYLLVCKNCTVNLENGEILEHSPAHYINSPSAFVYDPKARPEAFIQLLEESCFNDLDRLTLLDWLVATCCLVSFEFILFLTGSGSNGKKMYEDVLFAMFPNATEGIGLDELNKERFAKAQLRFARTNIFNETNVNQAATETIKSLSGGDHQSGDVKNAKMRAVWQSFIQLIFDTNSAPRFADSSYGFKRRFTRVKMPFTFCDRPDPRDKFQKKADPTLGDRLVSQENMSGVLNLIIARAPQIVKLRKICRRENDYDEYEEDAHSFRRFVEEFVEFDYMRREDREYQIAVKELYERFEEFVKLGGAPMSQFRFSRLIGKLNKQISKSIRIPDGFGTRVVRGFQGVKFKEERFRQFIEAKKASILSSNDFNDFVTSYNGNRCIDTDTVTDVTRYRHILSSVCNVDGKGPVYRENFTQLETTLVTNKAADSENDTLGSEAKTDSKSLKNEVVIAPVSIKRAKKGMMLLRLTADCEIEGKSYKKEDIVNVEKDIGLRLPGIQIRPSAICSICGARFKADKPGREAICEACAKDQRVDLKLAKYAAECVACGKHIMANALISRQGECETCYWAGVQAGKSFVVTNKNR